MLKPLLPAMKIPKAALGLAVVAAAAIGGVHLLDTDAIIERSFEVALQGMHGASQPAAGPAIPTVAGTEDFWLRQPAIGLDRASSTPNPGVPGKSATAVGDRITITSGGVERAYEVVAINPLSSDVTRIDTGANSDRLYVVTCRELAGKGNRVIHFVVNADGGWPELLGASPARTL